MAARHAWLLNTKKRKQGASVTNAFLYNIWEIMGTLEALVTFQP